MQHQRNEPKSKEIKEKDKGKRDRDWKERRVYPQALAKEQSLGLFKA